MSGLREIWRDRSGSFGPPDRRSMLSLEVIPAKA